MTTTLCLAALSARFLALREAGWSDAAALDALCGPGTYARLIDDLYATLRHRAGVPPTEI